MTVEDRAEALTEGDRSVIIVAMVVGSGTWRGVNIL